MTIAANIRGIWKLYCAFITWKPMPLLAPIISEAINSNSAVVALSLKADEDRRHGARQHDAAEHGEPRRAIDTRHFEQFRIDFLDAAGGVEQQRKQSRPEDDEDLGGFAEPQKQDEHRVERQCRGLPEQLQDRIERGFDCAHLAHEQAERNGDRYGRCEGSAGALQADGDVAEQGAAGQPFP